MAIECPIGFDAEKLQREVCTLYSSLAGDPNQSFHFHRGRHYAASHLIYSLQELDRLPLRSTEVFAGVGNPHIIAPISESSTVLDIGCGGGMDLLLAAQRVGPRGQLIGIDLTQQMLERTASSFEFMNIPNLRLDQANACEIPIDDASVDHVISNGVLNLTTNKRKAFGEIFRVLRPGAQLQLADIVVAQELPEGVRKDAELWAA